VKPLTTTKLKSLASVLAAMLIVALFQIAGMRPPPAVIDAIEEFTDAEIECDDAGNCSVSLEGSAEAEAVDVGEAITDGSGEEVETVEPSGDGGDVAAVIDEVAAEGSVEK